MIIVNADDWGRSAAETDAAAQCYLAGSITSVTAMVFMEDSARARDLAQRLGMAVGLHLNLSQAFSAAGHDERLLQSHARVRRFLAGNRYASLLYNPFLADDFRYVYQQQFREFVRLYGHEPSHVDGHHHKHLCMNMLLGRVIRQGEGVRRNFFFWPGEKAAPNRWYRSASDRLLSRRYRVTDFFFALSQCFGPERLAKVMALARTHSVELMTHPANEAERRLLLSEPFSLALNQLAKGTYATL
ncbi:MAG TPA: ChbG/HpnK family deacetylase [Ideonella sp.]|nr:ChbG/HpnK family deacetylase [Ideonella sp.]